MIIFLFFLHSNHLFAETNLSSEDKLNQPKSNVSKLSKPGDDKDGYHLDNYESASKSLERSGKPADLYSIATTRQLGMPQSGKGLSLRLPLPEREQCPL